MIGGTDRGMNFNKPLGSLGIPEDATFPIDEQDDLCLSIDLCGITKQFDNLNIVKYR
jgi:hypothetical protein